jgi:hypothetical protein
MNTNPKKISKPIAKRIMKKSSFAFTSFKNNVNVMRDGEDINMAMHKDFKANCKKIGKILFN